MEENAVIIGVRHGPFGYNEPPALSLVEYAIGREKVSARVAEALPALDTKKPVIIISGPSGRTRLTAEIWKQYLAKAGFNIGEIIIDERLEEVRNFSWQLFEPLVSGGDVAINGTSFVVNKADTNPDGLEYSQYFISNAIKGIPMREKLRWPPEYRKKIEGIESFGKVKIRMAEFLEDLISWIEYREEVKQFIVATHDALLIQPVNVYTDGRKRSVEPAGFVQFGVEPHKIVVKRVCDSSCDITKGKSNVSILKALRN